MSHRILLLLPLVAVPVAAQRPDSTTLQPVVVTATRLPTAATSVTQPVTVLRGGALRARGITSVADALRDVPGAAIVRGGSYGAVTSLFLRGGESRYTKVLIDGVPVNAVGGSYFLQNLTLDNVDRIEVVEGPSSALYGADAMSGVIQIFTRRGTPGQSLDAEARGGSYGARDATLAWRGGDARTTYSVGGGWHASSGLAAFNNAFSDGDLSGAVTLTPDVRSSVVLTSRYAASVFHNPTDYAGALNDTNSYTRQHHLVIGLDASRTIADGVTLRFIGADNEVHDLSEDTQPGSGVVPSHVKTSVPGDGSRRSGEGRIETRLPGVGTVTLGAQYQREAERSRNITRSYTTTPASVVPDTAPGSDDSRITRGAYVSVQGTPIDRIAYDASARYDRHSDFHGVATYHAGVSAALWPGARIRAAYGTGFNAPAFYETQGSAYNRGNPALQPEQVHALDVALEQGLFGGRLRASVGAFEQRFSQLIQYVAGTDSGPPSYAPITPAYYDNLTQARSRGYQGELRAQLPAGIDASASYTQTIARAYSAPPGYAGALRPGDALLRRPSHSGSAVLSRSVVDRWGASLAATYVGRRPDLDFTRFPSPTVTLPSYVKLDLSASAVVLRGSGSQVALTGRVDNVLDRQYADVFNFPAPRRAVSVGLRLSARR